MSPKLGGDTCWTVWRISLKTFHLDLRWRKNYTLPGLWGIVYNLLHPQALSKKCPVIFNSFFMVSSMSFINWNSVLAGIKPVFCPIILAVCTADSHFTFEWGVHYIGGFPGGSGIKKIHLPSRRHGFDSWVRKILGEWNGNPLQYSCIENSTDRGAWQIVHWVTKELDTTWWLNNHHHPLYRHPDLNRFFEVSS